MRIGLAGGLLPTDPDALDERVAAEIAALRFEGVIAHFGAGGDLGPGAFDAARCEALRRTLERHGLPVVQSWAFGADLVSADPGERRRQVELVDEAMRVAVLLGAAAVIGGVGSRSGAGRYAPHPENHGADAQESVIAALLEVARTAERRRCAFVLEPHVLTTLDSPERIRAILDRVGSEWIRVNLDPVNLVGSLGDLYDSQALLRRLFDQLGEVAVSGHVKDVDVRDELVLHLDETLVGDGRLDLAAYLALFEARLGDAFMFVEHVAAADVPEVKRRVDALVARATGGRA